MRRPYIRPAVGALVAAGLALAPMVLLQSTGATAGAAESDLPKVDLDQRVSGDFAGTPIWQTDHQVEAMAVHDGVLYAGGRFTRVRPPGAAPGQDERTRTYLAAFDATTGDLIRSFRVDLNRRVAALAVSEDGSKLFVAGAFSQVNGQTRRKIAALDPATGDLVSGWRADADGNVVTLAVTADSVYAGGDFTRIKNTDRSRLARLAVDDATVDTGFTADLDVRAGALAAAPGHGRLLVGGSFNTVNGVSTGGMASIDLATGALEEWRANETQPINIFCAGRVSDIVVEGEFAYVTGEGDPPGCYEGTYRAKVADGEMLWNSSCLGASQGITVMHGVLYKASHQHDCAFTPGDARGGYVGGTTRATFVRWHLLAQRVETGEFMHWSPDTNGSGNQPIGPHVIRNDGEQLFVGGDFTRVDGTPQQGLVRYGPGDRATPIRPAPPVVHATGAGEVTVNWPAVYDADSGTLTYRLYRGTSVQGAPVHTVAVESWPWTRPVMQFIDTGRTPGSEVRYRLTVSDGNRTSPGSSAGSAVVQGTDPEPYADVVAALGADLHWTFDGGAGSVVPDQSGNGVTGELVGGTAPVPGVDGSGVELDGLTGHVTSDASRPLSPSFSQTLWFRSTSITGGSLLGVTDARTGDGSISDRAVTMDNNGNVVFSVHRPPSPGSPDIFGPRLNNLRLEGPVYNDGRWHQVVATWDAGGGTGRLFLDGHQVFEYTGTAAGLTDGYQRAGYTDLAKEQAVFGWNFYDLTWPTTEHFDGAIDEVATFPTALTPADVRRLYRAGIHASR